MHKIIKLVIILGLFIVSLGLVVYGQKQIGYGGLSLQLIGVVGLLLLLHQYNKQYK